MLALAMIIIGIIMLLIEASAPGNFVVVPATVLVIVGFFGLVVPDLFFSWYSPLIALLVLIPATLLTVRFYQKMSPIAPPETVVATSLIGRTGVVTTMVKPGNIRGKVRIEGDDWSATADECIEPGTRVQVVSSEGVHVHVAAVADQGAAGADCTE